MQRHPDGHTYLRFGLHGVCVSGVSCRCTEVVRPARPHRFFVHTRQSLLRKRKLSVYSWKMVLTVWSGPRCCSTALMYSFGQRSDMIVYDEPLYAAYLMQTGTARPYREQVCCALNIPSQCRWRFARYQD